MKSAHCEVMNLETNETNGDKGNKRNQICMSSRESPLRGESITVEIVVENISQNNVQPLEKPAIIVTKRITLLESA